MSVGRYIAIEGPIGVGKTTLAQAIADRMGAEMISENELTTALAHLDDFYADRSRNALKTQLSFLLARYAQQKEISQRDGERPLVCDYLFLRDRIFASINLDLDEISIYHQIYDLLGIELRKPDLTVYLEADTQALLRRIKKRGIRYEKSMPRGYLKRLNEAYASHFYDYKESALLVVNTSGIDIVDNEADLTALLEQIAELKTGRKHYAPLRSR